MIKFHPTDTHLVSYAEGTLPSASSLLVSAHCDMCNACRSKTRSFTNKLATNVFEDDDSVIDSGIGREYLSMFECITNDTTLVDADIVQETIHEVAFDGRRFMLPSTLARFASRVGEWTHLIGKLWQAPVEIGGGSLAQLIYMEKGGSVPEHTHKGNEITLVINGQFEDGNNFFKTGDYISLNQNDTHSPVATSNEGCLVFTIIDKPLHFTSGWAKLINPLSQLYFKVNTKA
jgi:putative transcriptional regulator